MTPYETGLHAITQAMKHGPDVALERLEELFVPRGADSAGLVAEIDVLLAEATPGPSALIAAAPTKLRAAADRIQALEAQLAEAKRAIVEADKVRLFRAEAQVARLTEALEKGAAWFDEYARTHSKKAAMAFYPVDAQDRLDKAKRNKERADSLRAALKEQSDGIVITGCARSGGAER